MLLVDGDIIRYRCGFAAERTRYLVETGGNEHEGTHYHFDSLKKLKEAGWDPTTAWSKKEVQPLENCLQMVKEAMEGIQSIDPGADVVVYFSGDNNFRDKIAVTKKYKGNRDGKPKPTYFNEIKDYLYKNWVCVTCEGEADDEISIVATDKVGDYKTSRHIVVSNDKDLDQIPGKHYDWVKKELYSVSRKEARTRFFIQLLAGDSTDNVPGVPGIGETTAAKLLRDCQTPGEMLDVCWNTYRNEKFSREYFLEQANLIYLLKKPGELWQDTEEGKQFIHGSQEKEQVQAAEKRTGTPSL